jgi:predicted TIM-barrel fold metal-dependent hydrolase
MELWLPGVTDPGVGKYSNAGPQSACRLPLPEGYGFANYDQVFTKIPHGEIHATQQVKPTMQEYLSKSDELVAMMDSCSVSRGVLATVPNEAIIAIAKRHPERILGFVSFSPYDGMRAVKKFEEAVRQDHAAGLHIFALFDELPASDRRYYPFYAKCVELDVPVRIYTSMTLATDRAYDLGHPKNLDQVAVDFPELRIVAGLGGWPWVMETIALVRRHANLYLDTGSHRPRYFAAQGSGWEPLMRYGNSVLQDKVMVGLTWSSFGTSMQKVIDEYCELPLKDAVLQKWLYDNAARFFRLNA